MNEPGLWASSSHSEEISSERTVPFLCVCLVCLEGYESKHYLGNAAWLFQAGTEFFQSLLDFS